MSLKNATASVSDDTFGVLLRYAEYSGEKLNAGHAATAADVAQSTAFRRIAEAKKAAEEGIISTTVPAGDAEAFKVLLKYAQACGTNLKASHAAKAAGIAQSTAFRKIKEAKDAAGSASTSASADGDGEGEGEGENEHQVKSSPKKTVVEKASPIKKAKVTKADNAFLQNAELNEEEDGDTKIDVKKEESPTLDNQSDVKKSESKSARPSPSKSAAMPGADTFAVLLRYAKLSNEKLNTAQAAIAAGISESTVKRRVKAVKEGDAAGEAPQGGDVRTFQVLVNYAEAVGLKLQTALAAKAAGVSESTVKRRLKSAKDAGPETGDGETKHVAVKKTPKNGKKKTSFENMDEDEVDVREEDNADDEPAEEPSKSPKKPRQKKAVSKVKREGNEAEERVMAPTLEAPIDLLAKSPKKSSAEAGTVACQDAFAVLIRYAEFSGEKLVAKHAATASGSALRTAYDRLSKAKTNLEAGVELPKSGGPDAFVMLLKYAEASGTNLVAKHAAKAADIAVRTAYEKIAQAKRALSGGQAGENDEGRGEVTASPAKKGTRKRKAVDYAEEDVEEYSDSKKVKLEDVGAASDAGETEDAAKENAGETAGEIVEATTSEIVEETAGETIEETAGEAAEGEGLNGVAAGQVAEDEEVEAGEAGVKDDHSMAEVYHEIEQTFKSEEY